MTPTATRAFILLTVLAALPLRVAASDQVDLRFELRGGPVNAPAWTADSPVPHVSVRCMGDDARTTVCRPLPLESDFVEQYSDPRMADWTRRLEMSRVCASCAGIADKDFIEALHKKGVEKETIVGYLHKRRRAAILLAYVTSAGDALRQLAQNAVEPRRQSALSNARAGLVYTQKHAERECQSFNRSGLTAAERELVIKRNSADLRAQEQFWAQVFTGAVMTCNAPLAELKFPPAVVKAEAQPVVAASIIAMPAAVAATAPKPAAPAWQPNPRMENRFPMAAQRAPAPAPAVPAHVAMKAEADRLAKQAAAARQRGLYEGGGIDDWADEASGNIGALYNTAGAFVSNPETYSKAGSALLDGKTYADAGAAVTNPDNWGAALEGGLEMFLVTPFAMLFDNCLFNHAGGRTNPGLGYYAASCLSSGGLYAASIAIPVGKGGGMIPKYNAAGMSQADRLSALEVAKVVLKLETKVVNVLIEGQRAVSARLIQGADSLPVHFVNAADGELTAFHKLSDLGYPIDQAAVISSPGKALTAGKAAGEDAYLAMNRLRNEYWLVKMAPDGSPVGYKAARIVESTTGVPYSEIAATALKQIRAQSAAGAGEATVHLAPAPAGATKAAAALAQRLEPLTSKGVAPVFKKQGDTFIEVHLSASKDRALSRFTEKEIAELLSWGNKTEVLEDLPGLQFYMVDDQGRAIYRDIVTNQYAAVPVAVARSGAPGAVPIKELGGRYFSVKPEIDRVVVTASREPAMAAAKPAAPNGKFWRLGDEPDSAPLRPAYTPDPQMFKELTDDLAAQLHDAWREPRRIAGTGRFEPRPKVVDGVEYDIANLPYAQLPAKFQADNLASAQFTMRAIDEQLARGGALDDAFIERASAGLHDDWLRRNGEWAEPGQKVPFAQLTVAEADKDRVIIRAGVEQTLAKLNKPAPAKIAPVSAKQIELSAQSLKQLTDDLASKLHDAWREPRRVAGTNRFEPRPKVVDGVEYDIANLPYAQLPAKFQADNLASAQFTMRAIDEQLARGGALDDAFIERASAGLHDDWLRRNGEWAEPGQKVPFAQLTVAEADKDRVIIRAGVEQTLAKLNKPAPVKAAPVAAKAEAVAAPAPKAAAAPPKIAAASASSLSVKVVAGDVTRVEVDAIVTGINSEGMWFGGVDGALQRAAGNHFHAQAAKATLTDGKVIVARGPAAKPTSFRNVVFVVDDLKLPLDEIVLQGLLAAEKAGFASVALPAMRLGVMRGVVEKTVEETANKIALGISRFRAGNPASVKDIKIVVYNDSEVTKALEAALAKGGAVRSAPATAARTADAAPKVEAAAAVVARAASGIDVQATRVAQGLRRQGIDPRVTHIQAFADEVESHLAFARHAIVSQNTDMARMELLELFKAEARGRMAAGRVTYEWWNDFNFRLSILLTPTAKRTAIAGGSNQPFVAALLESGAWKTDKGFRLVASQQTKSVFEKYAQWNVAGTFPERIVLPTIEGEISIAELNALYGSNVNIVGLIDKRIMADGREMFPDHFYRHDHVHVANEEFGIMRYDLAPEQMAGLRTNYLAYRGTLPAARSEAFEFGYFFATHELPYADDLIRNGGPRISARKELASMVRDPEWFAQIVPAWARVDDDAANRFIAVVEQELAAFSKRYYPR